MDKLPDGAVWQQFCQRLGKMGDIILGPEAAATPLERAEGFRYLSRLLRIGLEMHLEHSDPDFPSFYAASHATAKIGADNPDNIYQNATISGARSYRIWGKRGTVPVLSFATKANRYAIDGTMASTGELDVADMVLADDGSFEIIVSREKQPGNWLPLAEDSSMVLVRQTFMNRSTETPAEVQIATLEGPAYPPVFTAAKLETALNNVSNFIAGTASTFVRWAEDFRINQFNALGAQDQTPYFRAGGDPTIHYLHGYWQLNPGEILRIDSEIPECSMWNFQLDNYWMESLDYRHHTIHVNKGTAKYNPDGSITLIIADKDPGFGSWIDTAGHDRGTMLLRWTNAKTHPIPKVQVVKTHV